MTCDVMETCMIRGSCWWDLPRTNQQSNQRTQNQAKKPKVVVVEAFDNLVHLSAFLGLSFVRLVVGHYM